jgi:hypothetical protein
VRDRRQDHVVHPRRHGAVDAEQPRDGESEHIHVDEADREAARREGDGEVRGDGRLADAALAARDGEHLGEAVGPELDAAGASGTQPLGEGVPLPRGHHGDPHVDAGDPRRGGGRVPDIPLDGVGRRAADDGEPHIHGRVAAVDPHAADHVELGDGPPDLGVQHPAESAQHRLGDPLVRLADTGDGGREALERDVSHSPALPSSRGRAPRAVRAARNG